MLILLYKLSFYSSCLSSMSVFLYSVFIFCLSFLFFYSVFLFCLFILSFYSVFLFCLSILSFYSVLLFCLSILSLYSVFVFCLCILSLYSVFLFCLSILFFYSVFFILLVPLFCLSLFPYVFLHWRIRKYTTRGVFRGGGRRYLAPSLNFPVWPLLEENFAPPTEKYRQPLNRQKRLDKYIYNI